MYWRIWMASWQAGSLPSGNSWLDLTKMAAAREVFRVAAHFSFLLSWADRRACCALLEGRHDRGYRLKLAVLHDALHIGGVIDVLEGISGDDDEIREMAGLKRAEVLCQAVGLCRQDGGGFECLPWSEAKPYLTA